MLSKNKYAKYCVAYMRAQALRQEIYGKKFSWFWFDKKSWVSFCTMATELQYNKQVVHLMAQWVDMEAEKITRLAHVGT